MSRHSNDFRKAVITFFNKGNSKSSTIRVFGIARQTLYDWIKLNSAGGLEVIRNGGGIPIYNHKAILTYVDAHPDAYNFEIANVFGCGAETVRMILKKYNYTVKKNKRYTVRVMKQKNKNLENI
jgi:transposase